MTALKERDVDVPVIFYARHPDEKTIIEAIQVRRRVLPAP